MKLIPLTNSPECAKVDDEDYDFIMQWEWQLVFDKKKHMKYAGRYDENGKLIYMHNEIWNRHHEEKVGQKPAKKQKHSHWKGI